MKRYYITTDNPVKIGQKLDELGYTENEACIAKDDDSQCPDLMIDTELKTYWQICENSLVDARLTVQNAYNEKIYPITSKQVEQWES